MGDLFSWLLGGLGALFGISNSAIGITESYADRKYNSLEAQKNRDFQTSERLASQQFELDMWNMNNEYNSIGSQIQRARDAGVNPASIVGGEYKPAQSSPVTTTPSSGSQASSSAGSQLASALMGNNPMSSFNDAYSSFIDSKVKQDTVKISRDQLDETIRYNNGQLALFAKQAGVADATEEQIRRSVAWMDELNYTDVLERRANVMDIYNDNYIAFQRLALDARESASRVAYNDALTEGANLQNDYQTVVNKYADKTLLAQATIEEVRAYEYGLRKAIAQVLGLPLGSSEFEFNYALLRNGQWFEYVDVILKGETDATLKPNERVVPYRRVRKNHNSVDVAGRSLGGYLSESVDEGYFEYNPSLYPRSKTYLNPIYDPRFEWRAPLLYPY